MSIIKTIARHQQAEQGSLKSLREALAYEVQAQGEGSSHAQELVTSMSLFARARKLRAARSHRRKLKSAPLLRSFVSSFEARGHPFQTHLHRSGGAFSGAQHRQRAARMLESNLQFL